MTDKEEEKEEWEEELPVLELVIEDDWDDLPEEKTPDKDPVGYPDRKPVGDSAVDSGGDPAGDLAGAPVGNPPGEENAPVEEKVAEPGSGKQASDEVAEDPEPDKDEQGSNADTEKPVSDEVTAEVQGPDREEPAIIDKNAINVDDPAGSKTDGSKENVSEADVPKETGLEADAPEAGAPVTDDSKEEGSKTDGEADGSESEGSETDAAEDKESDKKRKKKSKKKRNKKADNSEDSDTADNADESENADGDASGEKSEEKKFRRKSLFARIVSVVEWILLLAAAGTLIYVFVNTARGKAASIFGYNVLQVVTGSMEPTISVDDYILVKHVDTSSLEESDIIAYYSEAPDIRGKLVIHRIVKINANGTFVTMGDANPIADEYAVRPDQVLGRYAGRIEFLNWVASFISVKKLLLLAVIIPMFLASIYEVTTLTKLVKKSKKESRGEEPDSKEETGRIKKEKKRRKKGDLLNQQGTEAAGADGETAVEGTETGDKDPAADGTKAGKKNQTAETDEEKIERWKREAIEEYRRTHPDGTEEG